MQWSPTGYGTSPPTISTTVSTNDTMSPTGTTATAGGYSNGTAITLNSTSALEVTLDGIFGEGGSLANTAIGYTSITTPANVSNVNMRDLGGDTSAMIRFNEPGYAIPNEDETNKVTCADTDVFKIIQTDAVYTFYKNDVLFETKTTSDGTYYGFATSADGLTGKFILPSGSPTSTGTRLPPPPIVLGGL